MLQKIFNRARGYFLLFGISFMPAFMVTSLVSVAVAMANGESFQCASGDPLAQNCMIAVPAFGMQIGAVLGLFAYVVAYKLIKIQIQKQADEPVASGI